MIRCVAFLIFLLLSCKEERVQSRERFCQLLRLDGGLRIWREYVNSVPLDNKECPSCAGFRVYLFNSCKSETDTNELQRIPHPEFSILIEDLKSDNLGAKMFDSLKYYCSKLDFDKAEEYLAEFCKITVFEND